MVDIVVVFNAIDEEDELDDCGIDETDETRRLAGTLMVCVREAFLTGWESFAGDGFAGVGNKTRLGVDTPVVVILVGGG